MKVERLFLSAKEVAEIFGLNHNTVYKYVKLREKGLLPESAKWFPVCTRLNRAPKFHVEHVQIAVQWCKDRKEDEACD